MEERRDGVVAIFRSLNDGLAITLLSRQRDQLNRRPSSQAKLAPWKPSACQSTSVETSTDLVRWNKLSKDSQTCDRHRICYQRTHFHVNPCTSSFLPSEFPHTRSKSKISALTCNGSSPCTDAFVDSLRKYSSFSPDESLAAKRLERILRRIHASYYRNPERTTRSLRDMRLNGTSIITEKRLENSRRQSNAAAWHGLRTSRKLNNSTRGNFHKNSNPKIVKNYSFVDNGNICNDSSLSTSYNYLKGPDFYKCEQLRLELGKQIQKTIKQMCNRHPVVFQICPNIQRRYDRHKKICPNRPTNCVKANNIPKKVSVQKLCRLNSIINQGCEEAGCSKFLQPKCSELRHHCYCSKGTQYNLDAVPCDFNNNIRDSVCQCCPKMRSQSTQFQSDYLYIPVNDICCCKDLMDTEYYNKIDKAVAEWLNEIPVPANEYLDDKILRENILNELADALKQLSHDDNLEKNMKIEIEKRIGDIPMWHPSAIEDKEQLKERLVKYLLNNLIYVVMKTDNLTEIVKAFVKSINFVDEQINKQHLIDNLTSNLLYFANKAAYKDKELKYLLMTEITKILEELPIKYTDDKIMMLGELADKLAADVISYLRSKNVNTASESTNDTFKTHPADSLEEKDEDNFLDRKLSEKLIKDLTSKSNVLQSPVTAANNIKNEADSVIEQLNRPETVNVDLSATINDNVKKASSDKNQSNVDVKSQKVLSEELGKWLKSIPTNSKLSEQDVQELINELSGNIVNVRNVGNENQNYPDVIYKTLEQSKADIKPNLIKREIEELANNLKAWPEPILTKDLKDSDMSNCEHKSDRVENKLLNKLHTKLTEVIEKISQEKKKKTVEPIFLDEMYNEIENEPITVDQKKYLQNKLNNIINERNDKPLTESVLKNINKNIDNLITETEIDDEIKHNLIHKLTNIAKTNLEEEEDTNKISEEHTPRNVLEDSDFSVNKIPIEQELKNNLKQILKTKVNDILVQPFSKDINNMTRKISSTNTTLATENDEPVTSTPKKSRKTWKQVNNTLSTIPDDDLSQSLSSEENEYWTQIINAIHQWIDNQPVDINDETRNKIKKDLLNDIDDRQKYLQINPGAKKTLHEELENLLYQTYRKLNKVLGDHDMAVIMNATDDLMQFMQEIEAPQTMQDVIKTKQPEHEQQLSNLKSGKIPKRPKSPVILPLKQDLKKGKNKHLKQFTDKLGETETASKVKAASRHARKIDDDGSEIRVQGEPKKLVPIVYKHDFNKYAKPLGNRAGNTKPISKIKPSNKHSLQIDDDSSGIDAKVSKNHHIKIDQKKDARNIDKYAKRWLDRREVTESVSKKIKASQENSIQTDEDSFGTDINGENKTTPQVYQQQLVDTTSETLYEHNPSADEQTELELIKNDLADLFIDLHYSGDNTNQKSLLKKKLADEINKFCDNYLKNHSESRMNAERINQELYNLLKNVSLPSEHSLQNVEQVNVKDVINDWLNKLPVKDQTAVERLEMTKKAGNLEKALDDIKRNDDKLSPQEVKKNMTEKVMRFIKKVPLKVDQKKDLDKYSKNLVEILRPAELATKVDASPKIDDASSRLDSIIPSINQRADSSGLGSIRKSQISGDLSRLDATRQSPQISIDSSRPNYIRQSTQTKGNTSLRDGIRQFIRGGTITSDLDGVRKSTRFAEESSGLDDVRKSTPNGDKTSKIDRIKQSLQNRVVTSRQDGTRQSIRNNADSPDSNDIRRPFEIGAPGLDNINQSTRITTDSSGLHDVREFNKIDGDSSSQDGVKQSNRNSAVTPELGNLRKSTRREVVTPGLDDIIRQSIRINGKSSRLGDTKQSPRLGADAPELNDFKQSARIDAVTPVADSVRPAARKSIDSSGRNDIRQFTEIGGVSSGLDNIIQLPRIGAVVSGLDGIRQSTQIGGDFLVLEGIRQSSRITPDSSGLYGIRQTSPTSGVVSTIDDLRQSSQSGADSSVVGGIKKSTGIGTDSSPIDGIHLYDKFGSNLPEQADRKQSAQISGLNNIRHSPQIGTDFSADHLQTKQSLQIDSNTKNYIDRDLSGTDDIKNNLPPCSLSAEDKEHLERIKKRLCLAPDCVSSILRKHKEDASVNPENETGSQTDLDLEYFNRTSVRRPYRMTIKSIPMGVTCSCENKAIQTEIQPQVVIKEYFWNSTNTPSYQDSESYDCGRNSRRRLFLDSSNLCPAANTSCRRFVPMNPHTCQDWPLSRIRSPSPTPYNPIIQNPDHKTFVPLQHSSPNTSLDRNNENIEYRESRRSSSPEYTDLSTSRYPRKERVRELASPDELRQPHQRVRLRPNNLEWCSKFYDQGYSPCIRCRSTNYGPDIRNGICRYRNKSPVRDIQRSFRQRSRANCAAGSPCSTLPDEHWSASCEPYVRCPYPSNLYFRQ